MAGDRGGRAAGLGWERRRHRRAGRIRVPVEVPISDELPGFGLLWSLLPALAERETRSIIVLVPDHGVPLGEYAFAEMFCRERGCDCRRVMFSVLYRPPDQLPDGRPRQVSLIGFGWEPLAFYRAWMRGADDGRPMKGPAIEPNSPAWEYEDPLLDLFTRACLSDPAYVARVARHYRLFKDALERSA